MATARIKFYKRNKSLENGRQQEKEPTLFYEAWCEIRNLYGQAGAAQTGGSLATGNAITGSLGDAAKAYGYYKGGGFGSPMNGATSGIPWEQRTWGI